jgi:basic amino acid/polyamine antiporter, APA family
VRTLGGTTALLLLGVFTVVNLVVLVLRRDRTRRDHFHSPTALPIIGMITCLYLATPMSGRDAAQYVVAGWLLLVGASLFGITTVANAGRAPGRR